ncbi:MAG TPA: hypothetical protein PLH94_14085 [Fimbriimonadaceae bacterium]|nr:hypothetical protein [Fimbriimonadaceae bacterium]
MKIPTHIDEKLWQLAEGGDADAALAFLASYPELKPEFEARSTMVAQLRGARPAPANPLTVPAFRTPAPAPTPFLPRWAMAATASVALLGLGFASYMVVKYSGAPEPKPIPITRNDSTGTPDGTTSGPPESLKPRFVFQNPTPGTADRGGSNPPRVEFAGPPAPTRTSKLSPPVSDPKPQDVPELRPITIRSNKIGLHRALRSIGAKAGLKILIAPGLEDEIVVLDYRGPALQVLTDIGRNFGFTPITQGERTIILVPAADPTAAAGMPDSPVDPMRPNAPKSTPAGGEQQPPAQPKPKPGPKPRQGNPDRLPAIGG